MPSENITIRSGINPSKFMGSAHAAGSSLEERVGNNERKITILKNIINYKDSLLPIPKPEESDNTNLNISDRLNNIGEALGVIGGLFKLQLSSLQDKEEKDRQDAEEEKRSAREAELEAKKATKSKPDSKLKIPKLGFFETLKKFFLNVALGAATLKLVEWFKNPANRDKILAFTNFLKDNAKAIFVTLAALVALNFVASLIGILATLKLVSGILLNPIVLTILGSLAVGSFLKKLQIRVAGGKEFDAARLKEGELQDKANKLGVMYTPQGAQVSVNGVLYDVMEAGTSEQKAAHINYLNEKKRLDKIKASMDAELNEVSENVPKTGFVGGQGSTKKKVHSREDKKIINQKRNEIIEKYNDLVASPLISESTTSNKIFNTASSISQRVDRKRTPNIIDLRGGKGSSSNPTFNTGDQISSVSSEDTSNIDLVSGSLVLGLVG